MSLSVCLSVFHSPVLALPLRRVVPITGTNESGGRVCDAHEYMSVCVGTCVYFSMCISECVCVWCSGICWCFEDKRVFQCDYFLTYYPLFCTAGVCVCVCVCVLHCTVCPSTWVSEHALWLTDPRRTEQIDLYWHWLFWKQWHLSLSSLPPSEARERKEKNKTEQKSYITPIIPLLWECDRDAPRRPTTMCVW